MVSGCTPPTAGRSSWPNRRRRCATGSRINLARIGTPDYLRARLPDLQQVRIRIELDTDPPPLAQYEVLTLLTPIPFQVRLFDLPCLFAGKAASHPVP